MTSAAYDTRAAKRIQAPSAPSMRVVRGGRYGLSKAKQMARVVMLVLVAGLLTSLIVSVVVSQARITQLSGDIEAARRQLTTAQSTYDYLSSTMDGITSRANVQQIAEGRLGLVKADGSQMTCLNLEDQTVIERTASNASKLMGGFRTAALSLISSIDP